MSTLSKSSENNDVDDQDYESTSVESAATEDDSDPGPAPDAGFGEAVEAAWEKQSQAKLASIKNALTSAEMVEKARLEPNLVTRAGIIKQAQAFHWPEFEIVKSPAGLVSRAVNCDRNRWVAFDALFGDTGPHLDLFRGRIVDDSGEIIDDRYSIRELVDALGRAELGAQSAATVRNSLAEWALARSRDDLLLKINARLAEHAWDGTQRIEGSLVKIFQCDETPENLQMGIYFWLSLAARIFYPGRLAPITLSLFGAQNVGKSYFSKIICEEIMHSKKASPVDLHLSNKNETNFLREITGAAPVANIGEMQGFRTADINWVKQFIQRTADYMDYKYEGHFLQQRRWITIMDGNKYDGLQRDDSGNRRFYPMFVMQLPPDENGDPNWKGKGDIEHTYKLDMDQFREDFWLYMSEAKAWLDVHSEHDYRKMVDKTSAMVSAFNAAHIRENIGTPRDPIIESFFNKALDKVKIDSRAEGKGKIGGADVQLPSGVTIYIDDMILAMNSLAGNAKVSFDSVKRELVALARKHKGTEARMNGGRRGFLYVPPVGVADSEAWLRATLQGETYSDF